MELSSKSFPITYRKTNFLFFRWSILLTMLPLSPLFNTKKHFHSNHRKIISFFLIFLLSTLRAKFGTEKLTQNSSRFFLPAMPTYCTGLTTKTLNHSNRTVEPSNPCYMSAWETSVPQECSLYVCKDKSFACTR